MPRTVGSLPATGSSSWASARSRTRAWRAPWACSSAASAALQAGAEVSLTGGQSDCLGEVLEPLAVEAPPRHLVPDGQVMDDLPDRVRAGDRPGGGRRLVDAGEGLGHRRAMPGAAAEGALQLIGEALGLAHVDLPICLPSSACHRRLATVHRFDG